MPENKPLDGNLQCNHIVQKSEPLLLMKTVPFELGELKILDTYLSRINSHDPTNRTVTFTKSEYEQLMGFEKCSLQALRKHTRSMLSKVVELPIDNGFVLFTLFTCAVCEPDEYGRQVIRLTCSEQAKQVFFNIERLGYLQYELKNILSLTSKYSYLLYLYLRKERYRVQWVVPLTELRDNRLDLKGNEYYTNNFKYFKRDILDKAIKEVNNKTDVTFCYEATKTGRRITGIRFTLIKEDETDPNQLTLDELPTSTAEGYSYANDRIEFLADACNNRFPQEEMQVLYDIVFQIIPNVGADTERYDFLIRKYHEFQLQEQKSSKAGKPIKQPFKYFKRMLEKEM
jgi:hypothetical protein